MVGINSTDKAFYSLNKMPLKSPPEKQQPKKQPLKILTEKELSKKTPEEIEEYAKQLKSTGIGLLYHCNHPESKFWKRLEDIREGKDPNVEHPKRKRPPKPKKSPTKFEEEEE